MTALVWTGLNCFFCETRLGQGLAIPEGKVLNVLSSSRAGMSSSYFIAMERRIVKLSPSL